MGCCASTANPTSPVSSPVSDPLQSASRDTPQVSVDPPPNTDTVKQAQAPLPSSNGSSRPAHDLAVRNVKTTVQTQTQAHPLPDAQLSQSPWNHDTARLPEPPPLAVPASPSTHNDGSRVSSPAKIGTSSSQRQQHNRTGHAPSAYRSVPLEKSISAQPLSQSGLPAPSSHNMARTMSASGPAPGAGSRDRPRIHPSATLGTKQAQVAGGDDNQQFTSTLRTVLSHQNRYAPGLSRNQ